MTITGQFAEAVKWRGDHPAIEQGDRVVSYREFSGMVDSATANLADWGLRSGDTVALCVADSPEQLALVMALARLGGCAILLPRDCSAKELRTATTPFQVKAVIVDSVGQREEVLLQLPLQQFFQPVASGGKFELPGLQDALPLFVVQSSGTTGQPKQCVMTQQQVLYRIEFSQKLLGLNAQERYLAVVRCAFYTGMTRALMMLVQGATIILEQLQAGEAALERLQQQRISYTSTTPAHLRNLLSKAAPAAAPMLPDLKLMVTTAPLSKREREQIRERITPHLIEVYGTNEAWIITLATPADHAAYADTVGRAALEVEVEVVNENQQQVASGQIGELRCRGPHFPTSYWHNDEDTQQFFRDGWFYPGDLAVANEAGYFFLKGRSDDQINMQGVKFYPLETESVLLQHPAVSETAVLGYPDAIHGEVAAAFVVMSKKVPIDELRSFCHARLPAYKCPVLIVTMQQLPRNRMGKVLKRELRTLLDREVAKKFGKGKPTQ